MPDKVFLFDLDSTISKIEILPTIAEAAGCAEEMRELTEKSMYQAVPFTQSFLDRVELLKRLPVSEVSAQIAKIPLHEKLLEFIREHKERCYIVTGNLDVWIDGLVKRMGMEGNVFCSKGIVRDDRLVDVASVIDKNATVGQFVRPFVAVGDGSNDAEMISRAEIGIGFGAVRPIAPSALEVCTHAFYDEDRLVSFLSRLTGEAAPKPRSKTVVISCAGMGKRLGIGTTKCLVEIEGKPLITRHLECLDEVEDVRVVVGFQADRVIEAVRRYRQDVTFVYNHDYMHNGTGASVSLAASYANDLVLTLDGDLLVHPADMEALLRDDDEFVGVTSPDTDDPVLACVEDGSVRGFSRERGSFEWTGVCQIESSRLSGGIGHVYQLLESQLPLKMLYLRTKEIDTMDDYDRAVRWVRNGFSDEAVLGIVGGMGSYATVDLFRRIVDAFPARYEWERPRVIIDNYCTMPSRVRAILYDEQRESLVEMLSKSTRNLIAAGATEVVYACNTSHAFLGEVMKRVPNARSYLIDMLSLCAEDVKRAGVPRVYLLASEGTIETGIYQSRFEPLGIEVEVPDAERLAEIRGFIEAVKQNKVDEKALTEFRAFLRDLQRGEIVLGCTELPVLARSLDPIEGVRLFDPLQSVIDRFVEEHRRASAFQAGGPGRAVGTGAASVW